MYSTNIVDVYLRATEDDIIEGMNWYSYAHTLAHEWANGDVWKGAGVIAAYSPLTPWYRNMQLAQTSLFWNGARTDSLGNSVRAAQRIIEGEHPLDVLKGLKTRAFASAIATNGQTELVTIDSHAYSIAVGIPVPVKKAKIGVRLYRELSAAYCDVSDMTGYAPAIIQAITWISWRNRHYHKATRKGEDG